VPRRSSLGGQRNSDRTGFAPTRLAGLPIGWLLAYRPDPAPRLISSTERLLEEGATKLVLAPLSDVAVAEVTADTMRAQPDDALLAMARRSRGSPYLLAELLTASVRKSLCVSTPDRRDCWKRDCRIVSVTQCGSA